MNVHRVRTAGEFAFDGLLRVYAAALPESERKTAEALRQMLERPEYLFLAAAEADEVIGFAIAIALRGCDAALLEYLAVDAKHRGKGVGRLLFRSVAGWPEVHNRSLLVEVDSTSVAAPDHADRERRVAFYRRLGCRKIEGLDYVMPRVSADEPPLMEMLVYGAGLPQTIGKDRVRAWLEACYTQVYDQPLPDERIAAMMAPLPDAVALI